MVEADEDRLTQVLLILVDNAIEHSPSAGTITLGLALQGGRVVDLRERPGPGVPVADRERIFEPFARLPGARRSAAGSGLGLAIARQLVGRHDGELGVEDAPGGGARFVLRLASAPTGVTGPSGTAAAAAPTTAGPLSGTRDP